MSPFLVRPRALPPHLRGCAVQAVGRRVFRVTIEDAAGELLPVELAELVIPDNLAGGVLPDPWRVLGRGAYALAQLRGPRNVFYLRRSALTWAGELRLEVELAEDERAALAAAIVAALTLAAEEPRS